MLTIEILYFVLDVKTRTSTYSRKLLIVLTKFCVFFLSKPIT